jgi:hypothetical protein
VRSITVMWFGGSSESGPLFPLDLCICWICQSKGLEGNVRKKRLGLHNLYPKEGNSNPLLVID